jgi:hypothetical protein
MVGGGGKRAHSEELLRWWGGLWPGARASPPCGGQKPWGWAYFSAGLSCRFSSGGGGSSAASAPAIGLVVPSRPCPFRRKGFFSTLSDRGAALGLTGCEGSTSM